jgi:hypothetical protein
MLKEIYPMPKSYLRVPVGSSRVWRGDGVAERASLENGFKHFRTLIRPYIPHVLKRQVGSL